MKKLEHAMLPTIIAFCLFAFGCNSTSGNSAANNSTKTDVKTELSVPDGADSKEKLKKLWDITKPIIEADEAAGYTDSEYLEKRTEMFGVWQELQFDNSVSDANESVSQLIPRILQLVNHVYGYPGYTEEKREEDRANTGRTQFLIADIEQKIAELQ